MFMEMDIDKKGIEKKEIAKKNGNWEKGNLVKEKREV